MHTFTNSVKSSMGYIHSVGITDMNSNQVRKKKRILGYYALVYLIEAEGFLQTASGIDRLVHTGDLILEFPTVGCRYGPLANKPWRAWYVVFNGPIFDLWQQEELLQPSQPVLHLHPIDYWLKRMQKAVTPSSPNPVPSSVLQDVCKLQTLLASILHTDNRKIELDQPYWLDEACEYLSMIHGEPLELDALAKKLGMSYDHFRKQFKQFTGMSPGHYQTQRRIDWACEQMLNSNLSDKQIALALSFADEFYFSRRFKQFMGISPRAFRLQLQEFQA